MRVAVEVGKTAYLYTADGKSLEFKWAQAMSIEVVNRVVKNLFAFQLTTAWARHDHGAPAVPQLFNRNNPDRRPNCGLN